MAGFGSGVMLSLVSGMRGQNAISVGLFIALLKGGACKVKEKVKTKVKEKSLRQQAEDAKYKRIKRMLTSLGLTRYENNFKRNDLHDAYFLSLHYTGLREVGIPVGKSIAILDHIRLYGHEYIFG
ncbi:chloroplastic import inner membrane translocase subunit HP30-2-like [Rutidosis leptorrhynchoides]|uniref:chloroplastic import inner membrane translocase subunit HP30-2-like n=1 Tax=Rutidosis leptorrhynchoides TaxID=125765 RepID=UPI003A98FB0B